MWLLSLFASSSRWVGLQCVSVAFPGHTQLYLASSMHLYMRLSKTICILHVQIEGGSNFDNVFFYDDEWREYPNTTKSGPSSARQLNAIKWRFAGGPMMAQH